MTKIIFYFLSVVLSQHFVIGKLLGDWDGDKDVEVTSHIEVIVLYELLLFYFNIFGQIGFLLFSRYFSFKTIRERLNLGGNMRYKRDFLEFVQDDVHYTIILLQ